MSVNEVFYEIKDRATQRNVENYPVEIEYLQPKPESVKFSKLKILCYAFDISHLKKFLSDDIYGVDVFSIINVTR